MGFKIAKNIDFSILLNLLGNLKSMINHLNFFKTAHAQQNIPEEETMFYELSGWPSPSLVPIPIRILTTAIKKNVPVIEYGEYIGKNDMSEAETSACSVCLCRIERCHDIRELRNCDHVFHKECLDGWVDVGQVTCPLCRSMLFNSEMLM